jgi:REP element-mobilizing transposase RayT
MIAHLKPWVIDLEVFMKMADIREISKKIRKKYPPEIISPEILCDIIHILFEYQNDSKDNKAEV